MPSEIVRQEVLDLIADVILAAEAGGADGRNAALEAFPRAPATIIGQAVSVAREREKNAWWASFGDTADAATIRQAIEL